MASLDDLIDAAHSQKAAPQPAAPTSAASVPAASVAAPRAESYISGFGRTFDNALTGGLGDRLHSLMPNAPDVATLRGQTQAAQASLPLPARVATEAAGYMAGPGKILGPGAGKLGGGIVSGAAEGAAANALQTAGEGGTPQAIGRSALTGGVVGSGAGAIGKGVGGLINKVFGGYDPAAIAANFPSRMTPAMAQQAQRAEAIRPMAENLQNFGTLPGTPAQKLLAEQPELFPPGPIRDALIKVGQQTGGSAVGHLAHAAGGLALGAIANSAGIPGGHLLTAAGLGAGFIPGGKGGLQGIVDQASARKAMEAAYPAMTGVTIPNPGQPYGDLIRQATIGAGVQ